jgi:hypothetical protein
MKASTELGDAVIQCLALQRTCLEENKQALQTDSSWTPESARARWYAVGRADFDRLYEWEDLVGGTAATAATKSVFDLQIAISKVLLTS